MTTINLCEMTWPEIAEALKNGFYRVIIPVASIEQHGYHLPENTDTVLGEAAAMLVAKKLGNSLVAPSVRPGISSHHMGMPGTLTLRLETFQMLLEDYVTCYVTHGFREIVFLASHGGNVKPCQKVAADMSAKYPQVKIVAVADVPSQAELRELERSQGLPVGTNGGHADERETSEMLSIIPELVHMDRAEKGYCEPLEKSTLERFFTEGVLSLTEVGCIGNPCPATAEAGIWYRKTAAELLCTQIRQKLNLFE